VFRNRFQWVIVGATSVWLISTGVVLGNESTTDDFNREGNLSFLFAVYILTWAAFFAYMFYINRRQRDLKKEIEELKKMLEKETPP